MRTIHKYTLTFNPRQVVELPILSTVLSAQIQNGKLCIWVQVDPLNKRYREDIYIVGTGENVPAEADRYIGTVQVGIFVWHVYTGGA